MPKPSEPPQFGPILRACIQWVKKSDESDDYGIFLTPTDRRDAAGEPAAYDLGAEALKSLASPRCQGSRRTLIIR